MSNNNVASENGKSSCGSFRYMRQVSNSLIAKPRKLATSLLISRENRKSFSAENFTSLYTEDSDIEVPIFTKVRSLERKGRAHSSSSCCDIGDKDIVSSLKRHTIPPRKSKAAISDDISKSNDNTHDLSNDSFGHFSNESSCRTPSTAKFDGIKEAIVECKKDMEEFKNNLALFQTEFHEDAEKLNLEIKRDEDRYKKLCYKINNVKDLHQTQLQYIYSIMNHMDTDQYTKPIEPCIIDVLFEKINALERRLLYLKY